jgi:two-component system NarL family sensor kinase
MNGMLSSLLATYRNYGGAVKLHFEEFSMSYLVNECISEMMYVARDKNLIIKSNFENENTVYADRVQIKRVVMNLLSNAIKYAYKNTDLVISVHNDFENVNFQFENKSPYIPEEKQKTIFARYVSYAGIHKELGIGLGLYASKKIIESHHGEIYVKSYKDDRNIFGFRIPVKQKNNCVKEVLL